MAPFLLRAPAILATLTSLISLTCAQSLPVVDLGYQLQQATLYNSTGAFYNFSNIRYAAPPVGDLRFRAPQPPAVNRSVVQTGEPDRICPQAGPAWFEITTEYVPLSKHGD